MTTPTTVDRPDFGGQASTSAVLLTNQSSRAIVADDVLGPFPTTLTPYLGVWSRAEILSHYLVFDFYADEQATVYLTSQTFDMRANAVLQQSIPASGPWVKITIRRFAANCTYSLRVWYAPTPFFPLKLLSNENVLISQANVFVGAGVTSVFTTNTMFVGPAFWFAVLENGVSYRAQLESIDNFGGTAVLDYATHAQRLNVGLVYLTGQLTQIRLSNFEGVGRNAWAVLTVKPLSQ